MTPAAIARDYLPKVWGLARKMRERLPLFVDIQDLISPALMAVIKSVERFDPARGVPFYRFAMRRAYGAMLDELRRMDHFPRYMRQQMIRRGEFLPEFQPLPPDLRGHGERSDRKATREDLWGFVRQALSRREAVLIEMYFRGDHTLREIGWALGISESRCCQLMRMALARLRVRARAFEEGAVARGEVSGGAGSHRVSGGLQLSRELRLASKRAGATR